MKTETENIKTADKTAIYGLLSTYLKEYMEVNEVAESDLGVQIAMDFNRKHLIVIDKGGEIRIGIKYSLDASIERSELDEDTKVFGKFNNEREKYPKTLRYIEENRALLLS